MPFLGVSFYCFCRIFPLCLTNICKDGECVPLNHPVRFSLGYTNVAFIYSLSVSMDFTYGDWRTFGHFDRFPAPPLSIFIELCVSSLKSASVEYPNIPPGTTTNQSQYLPRRQVVSQRLFIRLAILSKVCVAVFLSEFGASEPRS